MILISLYDEVAQTWSIPAVSENEFSAERDFYTACANTKSLIGQHPKDFALYVVGEWHPTLDPDSRPRLTALSDYKCICTGANFVSKTKEATPNE